MSKETWSQIKIRLTKKNIQNTKPWAKSPKSIENSNIHKTYIFNPDKLKYILLSSPFFQL